MVATGEPAAARRAAARASDLLDRLPDEPAPTRTRVLETRAHILTLVEDWPEVERAFRAAVASRRGRRDPGLPTILSNLGTAVLRQDRPLEALAFYHAAVALRCELLAAHLPASRARLLAIAREVRGAGLDAGHLRELDRLLSESAPQIRPRLLQTARRIAEAHGAAARPEAARRLIDAIRELEGPPAEALSLRAGPRSTRG
jgi:hypothetical protein